MKLSRLTIGTRGSPLALAQTAMVAQALRTRYPALEIVTQTIVTTGDQRQDWSLSQTARQSSTKGLFTKELEEAMLDGRIDCAVHSVKDLPSELPPGLVLAAVLPRASAEDLLVSRLPFAELPPHGLHLATSSVRRRRFLEFLLPGSGYVEIRGNVGTRLRKLAENAGWDGTVLAEAGLVRLGLIEPGAPTLEGDGCTWHLERLGPIGLLPAPGQGIVGVEARAEADLIDLLKGIEDPATRSAADFERALLEVLACGCHSPVGVQTTVENGILLADARVFWEEEPLPREARMAFPVALTTDWPAAVRRQGTTLFHPERQPL